MPFHLGRLSFILLILFFNSTKAERLSVSSMIPLIHCKAHDLPSRLQDLDLAVSESFVVSEISYDCDVACTHQELSYLFGITKDQIVTADDLKRGLFYLSQKNKFETITLYCIDDKQGTKKLHVVLRSWWTVAKVRCTGILLGKETVLRDYLMQPGERFDSAKHLHSLSRIKNACKGQGYYKPKIKSTFIKDPTTKSVEVVINVSKGSKYTIQKSTVTIQGQIAEAEKKILLQKISTSFLKPLSNSVYDKTAINKQCRELKEYLEKKGYPHIAIDLTEQVNTTQAAIDLYWSIDLFQKKEFVFFGNHHFSKQELLDEILLFGRSAWLLPAHMLAHELTAKYYQKGFCSVAIDTKEEADRSFFLINEGPRCQIKEIDFIGVQSFEQSMLVKKFFTPLLKSSYFDEQQLKKCLDDLIVFYLSSGFWDVKASRYVVTPLADKSTARITITVNEGLRVYLNKLTIEPFEHLDALCPFGVKGDLPAQPFNFYQLKEQRAWIVTALEKEGYIGVNPTPEIAKSGTLVDVQWHVSVAKKKSVFGKAVVQGCSAFPYEYILRELSFVQGENLDMQKVRGAHQRLKQLELFNTIQVTQGRLPFSDIEQPILIKTIKDDPFEVRLRGGMGLLQLNKQYTFAGITYKAGGSFLWKNPFNYADQIRFDADFSWSERFVSAQYCRPWLFNVPARWVLEMYDMHYKQPGILQNQKSLYELSQQGFLVSLNRRWPCVETAGSIGIEWMETNVIEKLCGYDVNPAVARALNFEPCLVDRKIPFVYCEPTIFVDYLDNKVQPTRGSLTLATIKGMFPLKSMDVQTSFVRVQFEQSLYIPVFPCVLAVRFRVGHIFHQQLSSIMPSERFYLGGANSIRSYQTDMAPPLGELVDLNSKKRFVPQGGKSMFNINTEIRFPVYGFLGGVLFQDLGALSSNKLADIKPKDVVAGTGFGLRYNTPIGPLRFDIAWKWNRGDKDIASYAWFITFGNAF